MKACTASLKFAWIMTWAMATGDDPEADSSVDQRMSGDRPNFTEPPSACSECGATITPGVLKVSTMRYSRPLCMKYQDKISRKSA
jgi:hypothetical protein